jgi:hypothetical protein
MPVWRPSGVGEQFSTRTISRAELPSAFCWKNVRRWSAEAYCTSGKATNTSRALSTLKPTRRFEAARNSESSIPQAGDADVDLVDQDQVLMALGVLDFGSGLE